MLLISHRGNIEGPNSSLENSPDYINTALNLGFDVEIDVWLDPDGDIYLGHDFGIYPVDPTFLINEHLWCHAKNIEAFEYMLKNRFIHCFWHQDDFYTLTSRAYVWCYPGHYARHSRSIYVLSDKVLMDLSNVHGICSDYIKNYK